MRRSRTLAAGERAELFVLVLVLALGCAGLTLAWQGWTLGHPAPSGRAQPLSAAAVSEVRVSAEPLILLPEPKPAAPVPAATTPAPRVQPAPQPAAKPPVYHWFNGQKYRYLRTLRLQVTAYAPDPRCCWPYPGTTTASGASVRTNRGRLVAADTRLIPFHAYVQVPGYHGGTAVPVLDRGGAIKGHRLDVLLPTFEQAQGWGTRALDVKVYLPVDD